jgi:phosphoserine phosphatase
MHAELKLPVEPDFGLLTALLPALLCADAVRFTAAPTGLSLHLEAAAAALVERELTTVLERRRVSWEWRVVDAAPAWQEQLHALGDAVLTAMAPAGSTLPAELPLQLLELDAQLLGLRRLAGTGSHGLRALECYLRGGDGDELAQRAAELAERWGIDICLQHPASKRPRRRLFAFDMDSTLIECEVIDELAARAGVGEAVAAITARAMRGELDFRGSFHERMAMLRGFPETELRKVLTTLPIMPGAAHLLRTLRAQGHYTVILSGGFDYFARRVAQQLGVHEVHANRLQIEDGALTGDVVGEIVDGERKVLLLKEIAAREGFALEDTVAVGDGANDLPMLALAGMGVAFHAKPLVRQRAQLAVSHARLDALLYLLGVPDPG